jgi:hypothetical protein
MLAVGVDRRPVSFLHQSFVPHYADGETRLHIGSKECMHALTTKQPTLR